jgi:hypothetical protein
MAAYTVVAKPSAHFDTPIWAGSGSTTTITGMGFQPDILWIKNYDGTGHPRLNDSSKGIGFNWVPSGNNANDTTNYVASYTSDGFTLTGGGTDTNEASENYMAACWKANAGTTSSNTSGTITSTVQANTTAGISVVTYTGSGAAATIGHGLGVPPKIIICKNTALADRGTTLNMSKNFVTDPETDNMQFAANAATIDDAATKWNDTAPTSTVFSIGSSNMVSGSGQAHVAYCFAEVQGFSKFGYYAGNANASKGAFVYCGFRPKWLMVKSAIAENWAVKMTGLTYGLGGEMKRTIKLDDNTSSTNCTINVTSTGFELATTDGKANTENGVYFYMAFADMPVVGTNGTIALAV